MTTVNVSECYRCGGDPDLLWATDNNVYYAQLVCMPCRNKGDNVNHQDFESAVQGALQSWDVRQHVFSRGPL